MHDNTASNYTKQDDAIERTQKKQAIYRQESRKKIKIKRKKDRCSY